MTPNLLPNRSHDVAIDTEGEIARVEIRIASRGGQLADVELEADEPASYAIEVGTPEGDGDGIHWFETEPAAEFDDVEALSDTFFTPKTWLRVVVTDAAPAGETATISISRGGL